MIMIEVMIPVFLVFLIGYIGQKTLKLHIKSISTAAIYLMTPALIFRTFYNTKFDSTYLQILTYGILLTFFIILLIEVIFRFKGYDSTQKSALVLTSAFMNNGNLGAPVILFAFGETAFQYAVVIMVFHTVIMSTVGLYYAAKGHLKIEDALLSVVKMPIIHTCLLGLIWQIFNFPLPQNIYKAIDLIANAAIPTIMLVLGMQLAEIKLNDLQWREAFPALIIRLIISPIIAWCIILMLPVSTLLGRVMIVEAAMPSATFTAMYALQFDCKPDLVSSTTFISTLFSIVTLSILLSFI
ncbi:MAG: malate permease [Clostridia bacterium]|nr:hypothetical protein [Clostridiales bacterium]MDK2985913.1 malate permease [Clostridia bacterium]